MNLNYDVFSVDPKPIPSQIPGFEQAVGQATWPPSTSTLIWSDDGGALLVDCLITTTEATALATWIRSHGRELEYVYITHPHADHRRLCAGAHGTSLSAALRAGGCPVLSGLRQTGVGK